MFIVHESRRFLGQARPGCRMETMSSEVRRALVVVVAAFVGAGCGGETKGPSASAGGGGAGGEEGTGGGLPEPQQHRAAATTCTGEPPAGNPIPESGGECLADADCLDGTHGRCIWPFGGGNVCRYDECFSDADCGGASVCACRVEETFALNLCFHGNCIVDADCGPGGWCSPSAVHVYPSCMEGISPGSVGYFCRTEGDECLNDSDCGASDVAACLFDVDQLRWICRDLSCVD